MSEIPVKGKDGFYRNSQTNAIVNKNRLEYETYVSSREKMNSEKERIVNLEHEMNDIKQDLDEIKELLRKAIQG
jgi:hypothetical protein